LYIHHAVESQVVDQSHAVNVNQRLIADKAKLLKQFVYSVMLSHSNCTTYGVTFQQHLLMMWFNYFWNQTAKV